MVNDVRVDFAADFDHICIDAVTGQLEQLRDDMETDMGYMVPVRTGHLANSLFCDLDPDSGTITGGATAHYAYFVEVGHRTQSGSFVPPQPYVAPAFLRRRP